MLWKLQYTSKFWKLSSGHRTGKGQFSFQSQRREMSKNVYHTIALISHTSKVMLKILQVSFNSTWTKNFQMFKLDLTKAEEPEIKLPISVGSWKKQENSRKKRLFLHFSLCQSLWLCGLQQTVENYSRDGNARPPNLPSEKSVSWSRSNS